MLEGETYQGVKVEKRLRNAVSAANDNVMTKRTKEVCG